MSLGFGKFVILKLMCPGNCQAQESVLKGRCMLQGLCIPVQCQRHIWSSAADLSQCYHPSGLWCDWHRTQLRELREDGQPFKTASEGERYCSKDTAVTEISLKVLEW